MLYVKRIAAFLVLLCSTCILIVCASYLFSPKNNTAEAGMEEVSANGILAEAENTVDALVIGDSESYCAITPMQIWQEQGYTSYVCGTDAQTLDYSLTLYRRTLEKQSPKLVILETDAIYRDISESSACITEASNICAVFRYHNRWKSLNALDFTTTATYTNVNDYKGYVYNTKTDGCETRDYMAYTEKSAEISQRAREYVQKIKDLCDENGAQLLFLSTPSSYNWNYERHNGISALAAELECDYLDLNLESDALQIDWQTDTKDKGDHLNYYGAQKTTHYLANYLAQTGLLTDHRGDGRYESWDESLSKYEASVSSN